ncbi:hypothetical protein P154DRAFT_575457 [Amniculicola lignicola CBS 123094]|uniref:Uncharacterized protein n=1 Tax=Amniculicola lignicola CBS 123094 TaxID=1392246 RepID=A0A6A5WJV1_9PLEO|nr:hypothetical protein P154DRAFT_575457 [Amniculicola lignicola CBS 123094]
MPYPLFNVNFEPEHPNPEIFSGGQLVEDTSNGPAVEKWNLVDMYDVTRKDDAYADGSGPFKIPMIDLRSTGAKCWKSSPLAVGIGCGNKRFTVCKGVTGQRLLQPLVVQVKLMAIGAMNSVEESIRTTMPTDVGTRENTVRMLWGKYGCDLVQ